MPTKKKAKAKPKAKGGNKPMTDTENGAQPTEPTDEEALAEEMAEEAPAPPAPMSPNDMIRAAVGGMSHPTELQHSGSNDKIQAPAAAPESPEPKE